MAWARIFQRVPIHLVMIAGCAIIGYPLVFALAGSFLTQAEYTRTVWFPVPTSIYLENYRIVVLGIPQVPQMLLNTLFRLVWYVVLQSAVAILCGYVFARVNFRGRELVFGLLIASLLVPNVVFQVPLYVMLAHWPLAGGNDLFGQGGTGFVNEWPAILLPGIVNAYFVFLMRQFFYSIPRDYEEAGRIDGANTRQVLWYIYLPMLAPAIAVMVIFQSIAVWNDYLWPLIAVGGNQDLWTIGLGFQRLMEGGASGGGANITIPGAEHGLVPYPIQFAVATVAVVPPILVFLFLQRYFIKGLGAFGIK